MEKEKDPARWPAWFHGPGGASALFEDEADVPKGWVDHPSKVKDAPEPEEGTRTAVVGANTTTTAAKAAKTTTAKSQTTTPPEVAALTNPVGNNKGNAPDSGKTVDPVKPAEKAVKAEKVELDADGHAYDPALHAATKSKTNAGLWRMKVGVARPAPAKPLDL